MPNTGRKRKGLWKTMDINMIVEVFQILKWLDDRGVLEDDKRVLYLGGLTPENFMEYAQDVADDDRIWGRLPEFWEVDTLASKELQARAIEVFGAVGYEPSGIMTLSRDLLRKELRLLLTLCDANVKTAPREQSSGVQARSSMQS